MKVYGNDDLMFMYRKIFIIMNISIINEFFLCAINTVLIRAILNFNIHVYRVSHKLRNIEQQANNKHLLFAYCYMVRDF